MNLGLESISSNLPPSSNFAALPVTGAGAQAGSVQGGGGGGGFASTLAAAQRGLTAPAITAVNTASAASATVSAGSSAGSTLASGTASVVNLKSAINLPPRKPASGAVGGAGSTNNFVALPAAVAANAVAAPLPVTQASSVPGVVVSAAASLPALSSIADELPTDTERALSAGQQFSAALPESDGAVASASGVPPQSVFPPAQNQIPSSDPASSAVVLPAAVGSGASAIASNTVQASQVNSSEAQSLSTEPAMMAANTTPSELSFTTRLASSGMVWNATPQIPGNGIPANGSAGAPAATQVFGVAEESTTDAPNLASAPVLLANAFPVADSTDGAQELLNGNLPGALENSSPAVTANSAPQGTGSLPAEVGNLLAGAASAPTSPPTPLNSLVPPLGQMPLGQTLPRTVGAQVAAKMGAGVTAPSSLRTVGANSPSMSASASETEAGATAPLVSVSPFAVYFSSPGPGTEAAASTLPKMILPANAASRGSSTAASAVPTANSTSAGLQSNAIAPVAPPPIASQTNTNKDLPAGTTSAGATAQAAALHADSTSTPAAAVAVAQASAVAPASAVTSVPVSVTAAQSVPANSQPPGQPAGTSASSAVPTLPPLPPATGPVQMAQMIDRVGQAEMRVGMNTSAFGNVEVRTVVHASDVGLTIGSEKGDLRGLLTNDMPAISNSLQQQNLRLNNVSFMQGFASGNSGGGGGDSQQQRSFVPASMATNFSSPEAMPEEASEIVASGGWVGGGSSLSILA